MIFSLPTRPQVAYLPTSFGFIGNHDVIKNIHKKKDLLARKDKREKYLRTVLICPGGVQRGVIQGGETRGFQELGLVDAFDDIVGISAGSGVGYYTLAGDATLGTTIYYDDNVSDRFINFLRPWKIADLDTLEHVFRAVKPIHIETFKKSHSHLWVGVTDNRTGEGKFLYAKAFSDPISCLMASMNLPFVNGGKKCIIHGEEYIDGTFAYPLPIDFAIQTLGATDILVLLTTPLMERNNISEYMEKFVGKTAYKILSNGVRNDFETYEDRFQESLNYITGERALPDGVRIAAIYPEHLSVNRFSMNKTNLEETADKAQQFVGELFAI